MRRLFILMLFYSLVSCHGNNSKSVPADIIPVDSMAAVLTDVHILEATLQLGYYPNDSLAASHRALVGVLKKHHVTVQDYTRSTHYYALHPSLLDIVYEEVISNISEQKAQLLGNKHS